jgi:hypothetical protein
MTKETKELYDKLNVTMVDKDELNKLIKDRLDFGFDSIYFRYAITIDELAELKEKESRNSCTPFNRKIWARDQKMHFYQALEQLLNAHEVDKKEM